MGQRTKTRQTKHDDVVEALRKHWEKSLQDDDYKVHKNPGQQKNMAADSDEYPDIVITRRGSTSARIIDEVETSESVTEREAKEQWVPYGNLEIPFDLTVETGSEKEADKLILKHKAKVRSLWRWFEKDGIKFSKVKDY